MLLAAQEKVDEFNELNEKVKVLDLKEDELNDKVVLLEEENEKKRL
ncbi:hypothetical protein OM794_14760 [Halomonas sp. BDJS001]|nr:hypothetical protein [Halomonas sp. BDJS001]UZH08620.1 hypothetical protein OM794_14760 [Halomonas sp. BDJS001]